MLATATETVTYAPHIQTPKSFATQSKTNDRYRDSDGNSTCLSKSTCLSYGTCLSNSTCLSDSMYLRVLQCSADALSVTQQVAHLGQEDTPEGH